MVCLKYKPHSFLHFQFWNFVEPLALGAMHIFNTYFQNRKCQLELIANISITKHQYYLKSFFIWFTVKAWFHSPKPFQKCCMFHMQGQLDRHKLEVSMSEWENGVGEEGFKFVRCQETFWNKQDQDKRDGLHLSREGTRLLVLKIKKATEIKSWGKAVRRWDVSDSRWFIRDEGVVVTVLVENGLGLATERVKNNINYLTKSGGPRKKNWKPNMSGE